MFRRMYTTVALLLIVSTGLLLVLLGIAVYHQLRLDVVRDGQVAMRQAIPYVRTAVQAGTRFHGHDAPIRDSRGDSIYYYVTEPDRVVRSPRTPVPFSRIRAMAALNRFVTFNYKERPYRLYTLKTSAAANNNSNIYMFSLIAQEDSMLDHAMRVMWMLGGIGFVLAIGGSLVLARRLVQPTYRTWGAYRDSVLELSHELQTPLATVSAMLTNRGVDDETATDVRREIDRASQIVSDMLYLSKLRSGFSEHPHEPIAISDITEEVACRFEPIAEHMGVHLHGHGDGGLFVMTTQGEWERLVSTLFKNVVDHALAPSSASWSLTGDGRRVRFVVENEINPDENAHRHRPPERGIGLQIVQRLAQRMRGTARIERGRDRFRVEVSVPMLRSPW